MILRQNNPILEGVDRPTGEVRSLKAHTTGVGEAIVGTNRRLDRVEDRLDRIERRLDLVDASP